METKREHETERERERETDGESERERTRKRQVLQVDTGSSEIEQMLARSQGLGPSPAVWTPVGSQGGAARRALAALLHALRALCPTEGCWPQEEMPWP